MGFPLQLAGEKSHPDTISTARFSRSGLPAGITLSSTFAVCRDYELLFDIEPGARPASGGCGAD
jgi:hypothetical protein